jgi:Domain of unknown function (DUF3859)
MYLKYFKTYLLLISLLMLVSCSTITPSFSPKAKVISYGIYSTSLEGHIPTNTIFRDIDQMSSAHLIEKTKNVPCLIGTSFGVMFNLDGLDENFLPHNFDIKWEHPLLTASDGRSSLETKYNYPVYYTRNLYIGWGLEEQFELTTGVWILSIYYEDVKILQERFSLVCV